MALDPLTLSPSWWLDVQDSSTITRDTNGRVSQLRDKSGNGRHMTQNDGTRRPGYEAAHARLNGMPAVYPVTQNDVLPSSDGSANLSIPIQELYIVAAYRNGTETQFTAANSLGSDGYAALFAGPGSNGARRMMGLINSGNFIQSSQFTAGAYVNRETTIRGSGAGGVPPILPLPPSVLRFTADAADTTVRYLLNQGPATNRQWNGPVGEVIGFPTPLSASDREQLVTYLMQKWGLEAAAITATVSQKLRPATASSTAVAAARAAVSQRLRAATASSAAVAAARATVSQTLGGLRTILAARVLARGQASARLGSLSTVSAARAAARAAGEGRLAPLTGSASARTPVSGSTVATLGSLTSSASAGSAGAATVSSRLGALRANATGSSRIVATVSRRLGALTALSSGAVRQSAEGSLAGRLGPLRATSVARVTAVGRLDATLGGLRASARAAIAGRASLSQRLGEMVSEAVGRAIVTARASIVLGAINLSASSRPASPPVPERTVRPAAERRLVVPTAEVRVARAVAGGTMLEWPDKDPDDILDYSIDWGPRIPGDQIESASWLVPDGLSAGAQTSTSKTSTVWLSGGEAGRQYQVTSRIRTAAGRQLDLTVLLRVRQR